MLRHLAPAQGIGRVGRCGGTVELPPPYHIRGIPQSRIGAGHRPNSGGCPVSTVPKILLRFCLPRSRRYFELLERFAPRVRTRRAEPLGGLDLGICREPLKHLS